MLVGAVASRVEPGGSIRHPGRVLRVCRDSTREQSRLTRVYRKSGKCLAPCARRTPATNLTRALNHSTPRKRMRALMLSFVAVLSAMPVAAQQMKHDADPDKKVDGGGALP